MIAPRILLLKISNHKSIGHIVVYKMENFKRAKLQVV